MLPSTTISLMDSNDAMNIKLLRSGTETERERDREIHNRAAIRKIIETLTTMLDDEEKSSRASMMISLK